MLTCPTCQTALSDPTALYCSRCGVVLHPPTAEPASKSRWYHNLWFVLAMLLFVLGPLGLPLVWKNPRFSRRVKYALTALMVAYTLWLIKLTGQMVQAVYQSVEQFNNTLHL